MPTKRKRRRRKPGPAAERLTLPGKWREAVKTAVTKKRPNGGWPKHQ